jgi:hypothetical protein
MFYHGKIIENKTTGIVKGWNKQTDYSSDDLLTGNCWGAPQ